MTNSRSPDNPAGSDIASTSSEISARTARSGRAQRPIRSFVLREGRLTAGQERAFRELWPRFGVAWQPGMVLAPRALFRTAHPGAATQADEATPMDGSTRPGGSTQRTADDGADLTPAELACAGTTDSQQPRPAPPLQLRVSDANSRPLQMAAELAATAIASPRWPETEQTAAEAEDGQPFSRPITLEIGFGDGESLAAMAAAAPERDFIGLEVHRPGVGHLLLALERLGLDNVRILRADASALLATGLPAASLDTVQLFFPDPWPKKRHHKRRIVQPDFIAAVARALCPGGTFHLATDWPPYADWMLTLLDDTPELFENQAGRGQFSPRPAHRPTTKFERRGQRLGHPVHDLIYRRR